MAAHVRIGIDTGGTFTDVVRRAGGRRTVAKIPSTPDDPARAVLAGLREVGGLGPQGRLHHGTTVGTNAVLTRTGARVVLVTTAGFEDVLHLGRGDRADLHQLSPTRPMPLVLGKHTVGAAERMGADGRVVRALTEGETARVAREVRARRPEAVAVCLLHSPRSPRHERALVGALRRELKTDRVTVRASAELSADGREAERATTCALDAYVAPQVADYVSRLARSVGVRRLTMMRSDGGRMTPAEVRRAPVRTLLSGPAAGVAAAHALARQLDVSRALSFDVGGTSTDVAWLEGDELPIRGELRIGDHRASIPSLAVETVGAGGGSIVWLDAGGALRVGPESAGAEPGPACYGQGGDFALTDAWLLLERLPSELLAGDFALDRAAAERAARSLARAAGCSLRALCEGAVGVAAAATARALRRVSVGRGHDPRGAVLVAFGGAGPMLAAETSEYLEIASVLIPPDPGAFAAEGVLLSPLRADASRAAPAGGAAAFRRLQRSLETEVRRRLCDQGARRVSLHAEAEARYVGQAYEVAVPYAPNWADRFHDAHARRYGFADPRRPVEIVRLRVRGVGVEPPLRRPAQAGRAALLDRDGVEGPVSIQERTATTWVPRGWTATVREDGVLELERRR